LHAAGQCAQNIADPDMLVLVAESNGAVVGRLTGGLATVSPMWSAPRVILISMYVMPPWRGQSVGSRLVEQFTAWAKAKGAAQIRVTACSANEGAIRFYRRHGFTVLETTFAVDL
jgi:GNAT superfamily N-acetyltransferase